MGLNKIKKLFTTSCLLALLTFSVISLSGGIQPDSDHNPEPPIGWS